MSGLYPGGRRTDPLRPRVRIRAHLTLCFFYLKFVSLCAKASLMAEPTDQNLTKIIEAALRGSGFPFQTAVRHAIRTHPAKYGIHASEYPWRNRKNEDSFLDLVANNRQLVLTVECKKTKQEKYVFLLPLGGANTGEISDFRCLRLDVEPDTKAARVCCETHELDPQCPAAEFCVVSTNNKERMLERDAAMLISATDAFAHDKLEWQKLIIPPPFLIVPILITNAEIYTVRYEPTEVSLKWGEFEKMPQEQNHVPWIRFAKTFVAGSGRDIGSRSLFVVNASHLDEFLRKLDQLSWRHPGRNSVLLPQPVR